MVGPAVWVGWYGLNAGSAVSSFSFLLPPPAMFFPSLPLLLCCPSPPSSFSYLLLPRYSHFPIPSHCSPSPGIFPPPSPLTSHLPRQPPHFFSHSSVWPPFCPSFFLSLHFLPIHPLRRFLVAPVAFPLMCIPCCIHPALTTPSIPLPASCHTPPTTSPSASRCSFSRRLWTRYGGYHTRMAGFS